MISIGVLNNSDLDLSHGFIIIQNHSNDNVCWSNFFTLNQKLEMSHKLIYQLCQE